MLCEKIIADLSEIKRKIIKSGYWPKSLSGACNVTSILVQAILEKNNIDSTLVNNHKHAFSIINNNEVDYVLDLTACQISSNKFPEEIIFKPLSEVQRIADSTVKGKSFYYMDEREGYFFAKGRLRDVLKVNENFEDDDKSLHGILKYVCIVADIDIDTDIKVNTQDVNMFAKRVIEKLTA